MYHFEVHHWSPQKRETWTRMVYETLSGALMKNVGYGDDGDGGGGGKDDHLLNDCLGL